MPIDYAERIPNNVELSTNRTLQRALEQWQPAFLEWWKELGPSDFNALDVYLRTAISVDTKGWAHYDYVRMPDYRWGIFLAEPEHDRRVGFGDDFDKPAWQQVPGEYRSTLRRLIVTQGDTEPASVEQQRLLGHSAPSLYDLRNLFQVNVEEGRHLWAMVYLLHAYFGRDGREEAEELLARHSGDADNPRILGTFNEPITDWLSFFMFTFFTDRDGKFQLKSFAESSFDPLARTCRFMLTEEAHHMFVGDTGISRVTKRTLEVMREIATGNDPIDIGLDEQTGRVFTADAHSDQLMIIYSATLEVETVVPVGGYPSGLTHVPEFRRLYVGNSLGSTMSVIDLDTLETVATVDAEPGAGAIGSNAMAAKLPLLGKPYRKEDLALALRRALDQPG